MYFTGMFQSRHEILEQFKNPVYIKLPLYNKGVRTFSCLERALVGPVIELPRLRVEIRGVDYLERGQDSGAPAAEPLLLRFQQDSFRLWYQVEGSGILQNISRNIFGTARPGLLGVMEPSQRYTYLHQKGTFESFHLLFSLLPSHNAKCYWNPEIEGKTVLGGNDRGYFENLVFDMLLALANGKEHLGLAIASRLLEILVVLFSKGLLIIKESQFPKNKPQSLVAKARAFMEMHYAEKKRQNDLERECGADINYLNVIFKKQTGMTLYDYLTMVRMEHAKHLLETTRDPVTDIARRTGYPNANSFSRAFKRREKRTPLAYRRASREKDTLNPAR